MKSTVFALVIFALSSPVLAHAGDHQHFDLMAALKHLVSEPFHIALILVALGAAVFGVARYKHRKTVDVKASGKK